MDALPSEILTYIFSFLSLRDMKAIALTARFCYENSRQLIWNKPVLKSLTVEKLSELQNLPIRYLNTSVFAYSVHGTQIQIVRCVIIASYTSEVFGAKFKMVQNIYSVFGIRYSM